MMLQTASVLIPKSTLHITCSFTSVIDKLTSLEITDSEDGTKIPVEDIMIETIEIGTYSSKSDLK